MRRALAFLTPIGGAAAPTPGTAAWFPVVGALVGGAVGLVWWGAGEVWPPIVAAALAVAADLALTGMLHLDGLCDSADGLIAPMDRERRLAVMAAPDTGAFGVGAAVSALLLRWSALAAMAPEPLLVAGLWAMSRASMTVTIAAVPYARPGGLVAAFAGGRGVAAGATGLAAGAALAVVARGTAGATGAAAAALAALGVVLLARRRLGGFTGDVLGAAGVTAETAGLVAVSAW